MKLLKQAIDYVRNNPLEVCGGIMYSAMTAIVLAPVLFPEKVLNLISDETPYELAMERTVEGYERLFDAKIA